MKYNLIILAFLWVFFNSCSKEHTPIGWFDNPTTILSVTCEMDISDSSKILIPQGDHFILHEVSGSMITKRDTLFYMLPGKNIKKYFPGLTIRTAKTYSSNPSVNEFYVFDNGAVKLAGYTTGDSLFPITAFSNPLVIFPGPGIIVDSTISIKKNWISHDKVFKEDTRAHTVVKLMKTGVLIIDGKKEEFYLYQLTLSEDALAPFGGKKLIIPDAIYMQSYMVAGKTSGLICEWSIKRNRCSEENNAPSQLSVTSSYIEFVYYKLVGK